MLIYIKSVILYHPTAAIPDKYYRFYQKLIQLTESKKYVKNFTVITRDNIPLDTVYVENPDATKCIIYFHGNAGNLSMRFDMIKFLYNYCSVVIFDYRSYGKSGGNNNNLSCDGLQKDADAIWDFVTKNLGYSAHSTSLFGESLGCSIAIYLVSKLSKTMDCSNYPHSLILNAPFYSLSSMIEFTFDKLKAGFMGKFCSVVVGREYQSDQWITYVNHRTKIIIAHSPRDEVVPYKEGMKLYNLLAQTHTHVKFISVTGTHNNLGLTDNYIYALAQIYE